MATIKLKKAITTGYPIQNCVKAALRVSESTDLPKAIFVTKYIPVSAEQPAHYSYHHVAYVDELETIGTTPSTTKRECWVRQDSICLSFACLDAAETWCKEMYAEIQRLINTYNFSTGETTNKIVNITSNTVTETSDIEPTPVSSSSSSSSDSSGSSSLYSSSGSLSSYSSSSSAVVETYTFDGDQIEI